MHAILGMTFSLSFKKISKSKYFIYGKFCSCDLQEVSTLLIDDHHVCFL